MRKELDVWNTCTLPSGYPSGQLLMARLDCHGRLSYRFFDRSLAVQYGIHRSSTPRKVQEERRWFYGFLGDVVGPCRLDRTEAGALIRRHGLIKHLDTLPTQQGVLEDADVRFALKALYPCARATRLLEECHAGTDVP